MPIRFYRRVRIVPGLTINLSKSGPSVSVGRRGAHVTVGRRGVRESVGIPGTGLGAYRQQSWSHLEHAHANAGHEAAATSVVQPSGAATVPGIAAPPRGTAWLASVHAVALLLVVGSIVAYVGGGLHNAALFGSGLATLWVGVYLEAVKRWGWGKATTTALAIVTLVGLVFVVLAGLFLLLAGSAGRSSRRR